MALRVIRLHFDDAGIGNLVRLLDALLERAHRHIFIVKHPEHRGVDGKRIDHRLIALDVDDHGRGGSRRRLGHPIRAGGVVVTGQDHPGAESFRGPPDAIVVGGDHEVRSGSAACEARSHTCCSMGFPAIETRAFPGNREDAYRAGITPRILCGTIEDITTRTRRAYPSRSHRR